MPLISITAIIAMGQISKSSRDAEESNNKREQENRQYRRCWDWIIVSGNCHYTKDRSSFKTYRPVQKTVRTGKVFAGRRDTFVAGVGTVELKVCTSGDEGSSDRVLVLENVLHVPSAICHGFNFGRYHDRNGGEATVRAGDWKGSDKNGRPLWYGLPLCGLQKLALSGNPQGESYIVKDGMFFPGFDLEINDKDLKTILLND